MKRFRSSILLLLVTAFVLSPIAFPVTEAKAAASYGQWYPAPGQFGDENRKLYQADITPMSDGTTPESTNFACLMDDGTPMTNAEQAVIARVFKDAASVFAGNLENSEGEQSGYDAGVSGMQEFLSDSQDLIKSGGWIGFSTDAESPKYDVPALQKTYKAQQAKKDVTKNPVVAAATAALAVARKAETKANATAQAHYVAEKKKLSAKERLDNSDGSPLNILQKDLAAAKTANHDPVVQAQNDAKAAIQTAGQINEEADQIQGNDDQVGSHKDPAGIGPNANLSEKINTEASNPLEISENLDEGCGFASVDAQDPDILAIFKRPGETLTDLMLYPFAKISEQWYNFVQPYAFRWTFWTPHSERGDTFWSNIADSCKNNYLKHFSPEKRKVLAQSCSGSKALGFNKQNLKLTAKAPWYVSMAIFLQWLVSGFYFIVLFTAAIMFILKGSSSRNQLDVLRMLPKLLLSALLTVFAPWIIGSLITISNTFVTTLFSMDDQRSVGMINVILSQANLYVIDAGSFGARAIQTLISFLSAFYLGLFAAISVLRQLALIGLVILAPLAAFCLIVPSWQKHFQSYVKLLLLIILLPAIMAFILKLSMTMNPIIVSGGTPGFGMGFLGLMMMMVTLWAMTRTAKIGVSMATGNSAFTNSLAGKAMTSLGTGAMLAGGPVGMGVGGALKSAGAISSSADGVGSGLVPPGSEMIGMGAARGVTQKMKQLGSGIGDSAKLAAVAGITAASGGAATPFLGAAAAMQGKRDARKDPDGPRRISDRQAHRWGEEKDEQLQAYKTKLGRDLDENDMTNFLHGSESIDQSTGVAARSGGFYADNGRVEADDKGRYKRYSHVAPLTPPATSGNTLSSLDSPAGGFGGQSLPTPIKPELPHSENSTNTGSSTSQPPVPTGRRKVKHSGVDPSI